MGYVAIFCCDVLEGTMGSVVTSYAAADQVPRTSQEWNGIPLHGIAECVLARRFVSSQREGVGLRNTLFCS